MRGVLVEQEGHLDLGRIREVLASMEAVIGEHTLLPRLERLIRAASGGGAPTSRRKRRR